MDRQSQFVSSARQLFEQKGYAEVGMREIAAHAGFSPVQAYRIGLPQCRCERSNRPRMSWFHQSELEIIATKQNTSIKKAVDKSTAFLFTGGEGGKRFQFLLLSRWERLLASLVSALRFRNCNTLKLTLTNDWTFPLSKRTHDAEHQVSHRVVVTGEGQWFFDELNFYSLRLSIF